MGRVGGMSDGQPAHPARTLDKRIPIVIYADEWGGIGGTAGYVRMLAEGAVSRGYRVGVICHGTPEMAPFLEDLGRCGAEVRVIPQGSERSLRGRLARHRWFTSTIRAYPGCVLALMMGYFTRGGGVIVAGRMGGASAIVRADLTPPDHAHSFDRATEPEVEGCTGRPGRRRCEGERAGVRAERRAKRRQDGCHSYRHRVGTIRPRRGEG